MLFFFVISNFHLYFVSMITSIYGTHFSTEFQHLGLFDFKNKNGTAKERNRYSPVLQTIPFAL